MSVQIQVRRGTSAEWSSANPILAQGEQGYDVTVKQVKIGDGTTAWNDLSFPVADVGGAIHSSSSKTTPVDNDATALIDSASSNALKKLTWGNLKAALKSYFDLIYTATGDARLSDTRVPTDGSVTNSKIPNGAGIAWDKISKTGAIPGDIGAATAAQGAKADTALQSAPVTSVAGKTGVVTLANTDISGLGSASTHAASDFATPSSVTASSVAMALALG